MAKFDEEGNPIREASPETRFMVGGVNAKYLHGKSTKPIMSHTLESAKMASVYLSTLDYGKFMIFELVPVIIQPDGTITRQT